MKLAAAVVLIVLSWQAQQPPQQASSLQKSQAKQMLNAIQIGIRENYYDPKFHGIDLNAHFKAAAAKIDEARSMVHAYGIIAQTLIAFEDSHTYFIPPTRTSTVEYGWDMRMIGDACYITAVKPGTDAAAKGLKAGDQLLQVDQFIPTRQDFWKLRYLLYTLSPRSQVRLVVRSPDTIAPRTVDVAAKVTQLPKVREINIDHLGATILEESREARLSQNRFGRDGAIVIWKLSGFVFDPGDVDKLFDAYVKSASSLVIDMRGNGGGFVKTFEQIAGRLFDRDITVGTIKTRKNAKPMVVKKRKSPFLGKLVVLVDADSGSAAELLARVVQLEKRGVVIGDRSSGAVMQGEVLAGAVEAAQGLIFFHASVTSADLIMSDGASLERVGVIPDEPLAPTGADLAAGRDPVLARALAVLGGSLDPVAAAALFPVEWKQQ